MPILKSVCVAAAAGALVIAGPANAQQVKLDPVLAKQCAVWASYLSDEVPDAEMQQALLFATNYFIGYYEGATGNSIGDSNESELANLSAVANDLEGFTETCATEMGAYGGRMMEWGRVLENLTAEAASD